MILFKECDLFAPEPQGKKDVLVAGGQVVAVADEISEPAGVEVEVISAGGLKMVPGFVDGHVHTAGAGGEGGPATRTPEMPLSYLLEAGVTTVIGCLGTDGLTRSVESVLMKTKALRAEGVSSWMLTGAYQVPTPTILGDVGKDIAMIDEVIGAGEIAISDHRSSGPTVDELIKLVGHARVGGMLGGKGGIVNFHMGDAKNPFRILQDVVNKSELKYTQFLPTHCNRNDYIFEDSKKYGKTGYVDITASSYPFFPEYEIKPSKAITQLLAAGVPLEHITMTSDGCGSLPDFDDQGNLVKLEMGKPKSLLDELRDAVLEEKLELDKAVQVISTNPAKIFKLPGKGVVARGADADLVLLDGEFRVYHMVARGKLMVKDAVHLTKGSYEA
jgi:beta-aspartyl-dipeptidase (metallo-type)